MEKLHRWCNLANCPDPVADHNKRCLHHLKAISRWINAKKLITTSHSFAAMSIFNGCNWVINVCLLLFSDCHKTSESVNKLFCVFDCQQNKIVFLNILICAWTLQQICGTTVFSAGCCYHLQRSRNRTKCRMVISTGHSTIGCARRLFICREAKQLTRRNTNSSPNLCWTQMLFCASRMNAY